MSTETPKAVRTNKLGLEFNVYKGLDSTLCAGCGHDSITNSIIRACFDHDVPARRVAKLSGIGCSSKTTAYFLGQSHGFNAVHGRMAAIAVGVSLANRTLIPIGVSGDGDTASIGLGNFLHMIRRDVPIVYIIENNGCYGLTKGQFSATADQGSVQKGGDVNHMPPIDCCALAIEMGCGFVARSFSGDAKQLGALIKAALSHRGTALLDVVSPCVTFNNHEGSTKSYPFAKEAQTLLHEIGFVPHHDPIAVDYEPGTVKVIEMPDGSHLTLRKLDRDYDPSDREAALKLLHETLETRELATGLVYHRPSNKAFAEQMNLVGAPLATLAAEKLRPSDAALASMMERFR